MTDAAVSEARAGNLAAAMLPLDAVKRRVP
jgi:hypothetical protein